MFQVLVLDFNSSLSSSFSESTAASSCKTTSQKVV